MLNHIIVSSSIAENSANLVKRFTKSVRNSSIIMTIKGRRYFQRNTSSFKNKKHALRKLQNIKKYEHLIKMGKVTPREARRGSYQSLTKNTNEKTSQSN